MYIFLPLTVLYHIFMSIWTPTANAICRWCAVCVCALLNESPFLFVICWFLLRFYVLFTSFPWERGCEGRNSTKLHIWCTTVQFTCWIVKLHWIVHVEMRPPPSIHYHLKRTIHNPCPLPTHYRYFSYFLAVSPMCDNMTQWKNKTKQQHTHSRSIQRDEMF